MLWPKPVSQKDATQLAEDAKKLKSEKLKAAIQAMETELSAHLSNPKAKGLHTNLVFVQKYTEAKDLHTNLMKTNSLPDFIDLSKNFYLLCGLGEDGTTVGSESGSGSQHQESERAGATKKEKARAIGGSLSVTPKFLAELGRTNEARNQSIWAHGYDCIDEGQYRRIAALTMGLFDELKQVEGGHLLDVAELEFGSLFLSGKELGFDDVIHQGATPRIALPTDKQRMVINKSQTM
jgi:hypothetical protein